MEDDGRWRKKNKFRMMMMMPMKCDVMCTNNNKRYKAISEYILSYTFFSCFPSVIVLSLQTLKLLFLAFSLSLLLSFGYFLDIAIVIVIFIALPISSTTIKLNGQWCALRIGWCRSTNDIYQSECTSTPFYFP